MMKLALLVLSLIAMPVPTFALENIHAVAQAIDKHYNHLHTFETQFTEVYRGNGMERTESGTLWLEKAGLKKPGKMRWEYRSPKEKLFISDGKDAWFYVPDDRQARRTEASDLDNFRSPLAFLLGKTQLEKELRGLSFAPDVTPSIAGDAVLRGVPQGLSGQVSEVLLEVNSEREIVRILIEETDGSATEYRFTDQKENVPIPNGWFHFQPPAGTETIDGLEP
jgi:outer membrane lipoprotein carrier protein